MKIVLIYSGGIDSTTLLYDCLSKGHTVRALSVDYGQRHAIELHRARQICYKVKHAFWHFQEHNIVDLRSLTPLLRGSSQTDLSVPVPEGHYTDESMKATVVPNRNMLMLAVATAWAISTKSDAVAYAAHAGDNAIYPDCRPEFATALEAAIHLADWHAVGLLRPFINLTKTDIVKLGAALGVPFDLTWSCYAPKYPGGGTLPAHCGRCGTDVERKEAFAQAGVRDPTFYAPDAP